MTRYVTRPTRKQLLQVHIRAEDDFWNPLLPSISVTDHEPAFTGLLDAQGDEIWREPNPMGFHW